MRVSRRSRLRGAQSPEAGPRGTTPETRSRNQIPGRSCRISYYTLFPSSSARARSAGDQEHTGAPSLQSIRFPWILKKKPGTRAPEAVARDISRSFSAWPRRKSLIRENPPISAHPSSSPAESHADKIPASAPAAHGVENRQSKCGLPNWLYGLRNRHQRTKIWQIRSLSRSTLWGENYRPQLRDAKSARRGQRRTCGRLPRLRSLRTRAKS